MNKVYIEKVRTLNGTATTYRHDCPNVGDVELSDDWRFCPWCACGLTRAKARAEREANDG